MKALEIKKLVERELGYSITPLTRTRPVVYGRAIYFKICRDRTNLSLKQIGDTLNLNHATVVHSITKVFPSFEQYNPEFMDIYNRIINSDSYTPIKQKYESLKLQHNKLQKQYNKLVETKIETKHKPILTKVKQIPDPQLKKAEFRISKLIERLI